MEDLKLATEQLITLANQQIELAGMIQESYPNYDFEFLQDLINSLLAEFTELKKSIEEDMGISSETTTIEE